ncbi:hypothetical protein Tco_1259640, partial [Tanacetum coccineum]
GNPETDLEDSVRLNSPEDKKRAGAELTQQNDKRNYQEELFTHKEEMAPMASSDSEVKTCSKTCLKNNETLKKQYDDLRTELNKSQSDLANYKRALASVEEQPAFYKQNEVNTANQRKWLMLLGRIGLMLLKHQHVGFGDLSNLIGNPETKLEDLVRLNSLEDKKLMLIEKITSEVNAIEKIIC